MLNSTTDSKGHIKFGIDHLTSLSHLHIMGSVAGIDRGSRGTDRGTNDVRKILQDFKISRLFHRPSTGNNDLRFG